MQFLNPIELEEFKSTKEFNKPLFSFDIRLSDPNFNLTQTIDSNNVKTIIIEYTEQWLLKSNLPQEVKNDIYCKSIKEIKAEVEGIIYVLKPDSEFISKYYELESDVKLNLLPLNVFEDNNDKVLNTSIHYEDYPYIEDNSDIISREFLEESKKYEYKNGVKPFKYIKLLKKSL